jgi:hypothetical protein
MVNVDVKTYGPDVGAAVYAAAAALNLTVASDGGLRKYPGSRHWHIKNGKGSGTLEVTYWPDKNRLWVTYHSNRVGDGWVEEMAPKFAEKLSGGG